MNGIIKLVVNTLAVFGAANLYKDYTSKNNSQTAKVTNLNDHSTRLNGTR